MKKQNKNITKKEITGSILKKELGLNRAFQDWHNKNKSGGNFGVSLYLEKDFNKNTDKVLSGCYDEEGFIVGLELSYIRYGMGGVVRIPKEFLTDFDKLKDFLIIQLKGGIK